jgi:hypothetical protein
VKKLPRQAFRKAIREASVKELIAFVLLRAVLRRMSQDEFEQMGSSAKPT